MYLHTFARTHTHTHTHSYFSLVVRVFLFNSNPGQYLRGTLLTQEAKDMVVILKDKGKTYRRKERMQGFMRQNS